MLRLTRTAIGLLTAQYRSVLRKCWAINVGVFGLMGKAVASVAKGAADTIGGTLNGYGINVMAYMLSLLDSLLNIKSNAFDEQSAKATATKLPFGAPTVAGTLSAFGVNVMDGLSEKRVFKTKLITSTAIGLAVAGVMLPTRVMADEVVNYNNETWSNYGYYIKIIPGIANVQIYANEHTTIIDEGGLSTVYGDYAAAYRWNGLSLRDVSGDYKTQLNSGGFKLNGSDTMTGITHNTTVDANASSTVAKLVSESTLARSLNNYYTLVINDGKFAYVFNYFLEYSL